MTEKPGIVRREFLAASTAGVLVPLTDTVAAESPKEATAQGTGTRLVDSPQVKRDFSKDGRSRKVLFVAHCALNQNARHVDCADFPALMKPLLAAVAEREIGIVQLPCPELMVLGMGRDRDVPPLDTIREALELPDAEPRLRRLIDQVVYQLEEYRFQGFTVLGILGKNGSPSCGVETTSFKQGFGPGEGIFFRMLAETLKEKGLPIPIKGIDDHRQEETMKWLDERLGEA